MGTYGFQVDLKCVTGNAAAYDSFVAVGLFPSGYGVGDEQLQVILNLDFTYGGVNTGIYCGTNNEGAFSFDTWYTLKLEVDTVAEDITYWLDGVEQETDPWYLSAPFSAPTIVLGVSTAGPAGFKIDNLHYYVDGVEVAADDFSDGDLAAWVIVAGGTFPDSETGGEYYANYTGASGVFTYREWDPSTGVRLHLLADQQTGRLYRAWEV